MNEIQRLIHEMCPDGVPMVALGEICSEISAGGDVPKNSCKGLLLPTKEYPYPIFSNGNGDNSLYGYTNECKIKVDSVTISARGTIGWHTVRKANFTPIVRLITLLPNISLILPYYLDYALYITDICGTKGGIPQLTVPTVKKIQIPLPPLPIQQRIVEILDKFTSLVSSLDSEIALRQKQYEYYRNKLLSFEEGDEGAEWKSLGELCKNISSGKCNKKADNGKYAVYGSTGIIAYSDEYSYDRDQILVARVGANAGYVHIAKGKYDVTDNTLIINLKDNSLLRYLYFILIKENLNQYAKGGGQPLVTGKDLKDLVFPFPPLNRQLSIVRSLDTFASLLTNLKKERELRQKQYEYYREKLLTFA